MLAKIAARHRLKAPAITREGEERLLAQPWRGNVRELSHEIERALIFGGNEPIDFAALGPAGAPRSAAWRNPAWHLPETGFSLEEAVDELISEAMRASDDNVSAAARRLGVTRDFVRYRLPQRKAED
jgi:DNA-binding NtrC family response regulator